MEEGEDERDIVGRVERGRVHGMSLWGWSPFIVFEPSLFAIVS